MSGSTVTVVRILKECKQQWSYCEVGEYDTSAEYVFTGLKDECKKYLWIHDN